VRHLASLTMIVCAVLVVSAGALTLRALELPPVAHYSSIYPPPVGFVLDRTSEFAKLRFDGTEEILVLRWQPAAGGMRNLLRDDGALVLRISGLGGVTLFTDQNQAGIPVANDARANPLGSPAPPSIEYVRQIAGQIMGQLRAETGREIIFEANWNEAARDPGARAILFDAVRNAGTALFNMARTPQGRIGLINYLRRVRFVRGAMATTTVQGDMLIVMFSVEQGLAGRLSSYAIRGRLNQLMR